MDTVDALIDELRKDREVSQARFSNKLLATVGEVCSRYGYGATRLYLLGREDDESRVLLKILSKIEESRIPTELGTLILKKLNAIKFARGI